MYTRKALTILGLSLLLPHRKVLVAIVAILTLMGMLPAIFAQESFPGPSNVHYNGETEKISWTLVPGVDRYQVRIYPIHYPGAPLNELHYGGIYLTDFDPPRESISVGWGRVDNVYKSGIGFVLLVISVHNSEFHGTSRFTYIPPAWRSFYTSSKTIDLQNLNLGSHLGYFLLGAIGKAFRVSETQIDFYEIIEGTTQGVLALRITQAEVDEALEAAGEATCVKASRNDRASVTVWADGNVTLSIGPDYETKIFHVLLEGGLGGSIIGHSTTYGPPAGAHCANY